MRIVWDEPKREANLSKHNALFLRSYGRGWRAIGETIQGVVSVVFVTLSTEAVSVISMRPASRYERKLHADR